MIELHHPELDKTIEVGTERAARVHEASGWIRSEGDSAGITGDGSWSAGTTEGTDVDQAQVLGDEDEEKEE